MIEGKMKKKMGRAAPLIGFAFLLATIAMGCKKEPTTTTVPVPNAQGRPAVDFAKPAATGTTGGYGAVPFDWVLMVPPDSTVPHSVDSSAPVLRWSVVSRFDSADSCKQVVTALKNGDKVLASRDLDPLGRLTEFLSHQRDDPDSERARARVDAAICIATEDPRFKEK